MTAAESSSYSTDAAWLSLFANVLVLPGVGTLLLGRRVLGCAQLSLTAVGFALLLAGGRAEPLGLGLLLGALAWATETAISALDASR